VNRLTCKVLLNIVAQKSCVSQYFYWERELEEEAEEEIGGTMVTG